MRQAGMADEAKYDHGSFLGQYFLQLFLIRVSFQF